MKIVYISSSCPVFDIEKINKQLLKKLQVSSNKYHNALITGLIENGCNVQSIYGLPINHKMSKKRIWKSVIQVNNKCKYIQCGFINIPVIKYISLNIVIYKYLKKICKKSNVDKPIIIIDGAFVSVYPVIKRFIKKIPTYAVIADVYDYMASVENKSNYCNIISRSVRKYIASINKKISGYIFLNKNMNELYKSDNYVVIEGIVYNCPDMVTKNSDNKSKKIILYAGGLLEKFGICNLIDAFMSMPNSDYELHLYGYTDMEGVILNSAKKDSRIKYFGMCDSDVVVKAEQNATILVNPRPTNVEFQRYSFPSKIIEYMASGTPVLTTKIDGMPDDYESYLFFFEDHTAMAIKNKILEVLKMDSIELNKKGKAAYNFIKRNKSPKEQAKKVLAMVTNHEN